MFRKKVKIKIIRKTSQIGYKTQGTTCVDLHNCSDETISLQPGQRMFVHTGIAIDLHNCSDETISLYPGQRMFVHTGIAIELPKNYEAQIRPRSGLVIKHGITVLNSPGTIDEDYRGEIRVTLVNLSDRRFLLRPNARVAQMAFKRVYRPKLKFVERIAQSIRGVKGLGSTGN
jgi:dUTP pyrophosphatase